MKIYFLCCDEWCYFSHLSPFFLFAFLLSYCHSKRPEDWEESIFMHHKECGYRLRDNVYFHMYISTSPCGDGRLNSPYEITTECKKAGLSVSVFIPQKYAVFISITLIVSVTYCHKLGHFSGSLKASALLFFSSFSCHILTLAFQPHCAD